MGNQRDDAERKKKSPAKQEREERPKEVIASVGHEENAPAVDDDPYADVPCTD